jgi:3-dehydrosphinganine reductase
VAQDLVEGSTLGYFGVSTGVDGWLLRQLHPGMTPVNHTLEVLQQILFAPIARLVAVFYVLSWDGLVARETHKAEQIAASKTLTARLD